MARQRQVKKADERKLELVNSARRLFFTRGYAQTTITDIIEDSEVSKGLFYYYFGSKEEILDEIVQQLIAHDVEVLTAVMGDASLTVPQRLMGMLRRHRSLMADSAGHVTAQLKAIANPEIVIRTIRQTVLHLTPLFTRVVEQGTAEGIFNIQDPEVCLEVLLNAYTFDAVFEDGAHLIGKANAFRRVFERTLGAAPMALDVPET
ncbi:MAG: TetR/AcrR family transcriptional regulator [Propionibacteriaceae bacterium]|nr:TetR/AcrR family transcriptional regulator [Propionibacteriaceae bacterium]